MIRRLLARSTVVLLALAAPSLARAQTASDSLLQRIAVEARERSQLYPLAQTLLDSIGPRLTGTAEQRRANAWALVTYHRWGIPVREHRYGTWMDWRRGVAHVDLVAPRVRALEGMLSTWSPGTSGTIEAGVVVSPDVQSLAELETWLPTARGKLVLLSFPWPSCRPDADWQRFASAEAVARMQAERDSAFRAWYAGRRGSGVRGEELVRRLSAAGALGVVTLLVPPPAPDGWGVMKASTTVSATIPEIGLGCEDYGLVYRLAERGQGPILRVRAEATWAGEAPVANVVAELRGREKPDEYVVLSAHLDSWDPASGATDNGTGTVVMMEAMRILKAVYPNPRRTIIAGHWVGEEQGLIGSGAFAADHPQVLAGLQALLNQDSGTGRLTAISMEGLTRAGAFFRRWLSRMPAELTRDIQLRDPGNQGRGSDYFSFTCRGAPAFNLVSRDWDYFTQTWHSNRDTFDKLVFEDLRTNAALIAMLAYLASEETERMPRDRAVPSGPQPSQPACGTVRRSWSERAR